jgi:hypothetical protein
MRDKYYEAALAYAKSKGWERDELPPGDRGTSHTCPLAIACGGIISIMRRDMNRDVCNFILRFDQGLYPDLIADDD